MSRRRRPAQAVVDLVQVVVDVVVDVEVTVAVLIVIPFLISADWRVRGCLFAAEIITMQRLKRINRNIFLNIK